MKEHLCGKCQKPGTMTAAASVVLVWAPGLLKPYPLIPAEDYHVCGQCRDAVFTLVDKSVEAHPMTRAAGQWTRAILVFQDGHGIDVRHKDTMQRMGLA